MIKLNNQPQMLRKMYNCGKWVICDMNCKCKLMEFDPPEGCPIELIPTNGNLQLKQVTFDKLKSVAKFGTQKLIDGEWTEK